MWVVPGAKYPWAKSKIKAAEVIISDKRPLTRDFISWVGGNGTADIEISRGCLAEDSELLTPNGFVRVNQVEKGDLVATDKGMTKVLNKWDQGIKQVYELVLGNGLRIRGTEDHRIRVTNGKGIYWRELSKLNKERILVNCEDLSLGLLPAELEFNQLLS